MTRSPKTLENANDDFNILSGLGMPVHAHLLGIHCKLKNKNSLMHELLELFLVTLQNPFDKLCSQ